MRRQALWVTAAKRTRKVKPRRYLRARSPQRAAQERQYRKRVKEWLAGKMCAVFPKLPATQCHHRNGRRGRLLLYEPWWRPVSEIGHHWINANVEQARRRDLICPVGQWNSPPP